nr:helix-turn-helix transcriptional regulator [Paenibacillus hamazuiensis]
MIKGYIDAIILSVLQDKDAYGYEITKVVNQSSDGAFELKEGTLYPALKRLEASGMIEGYWDERPSGPRRRYYRITPAGKGKLKESKETWLKNAKVIHTFLGGLSYGGGRDLPEPNS